MSDTSGLTPYREVADLLIGLPMLLREARRARQLSIRAAAKQLDMSQSTVFRIEAGEDHVVSNAVTVLQWLDPTALKPSNDKEVGREEATPHAPRAQEGAQGHR